MSLRANSKTSGSGRKIDLKVQPVDKPELSAQLVAEDIAEQLVKTCQFPPRHETCRSDHGSGSARYQDTAFRSAGGCGNGTPVRKGNSRSHPLQTLRAKIDYGFAIARTTLGVIGVKVWINLGDYLEEASHAPDGPSGSSIEKASAGRVRGNAWRGE
jgi:small subunit ribosomal protein S3